MKAANLQVNRFAQHFGHPQGGAFTVAQIAAQFGVTRQRAAGDTIAEIVAKTGITRSSLYRHLPACPADPITAAGTKPTRPMTQPAA